MKILYLAKHDSGGNDDEGAIAHALRELGHTVALVSEATPLKAKDQTGCDLLLFHKWCDPVLLAHLHTLMPAAFWYFDLVEWPDPSLAGRNRGRVEWFHNVLPHVDLGFCTDGDWVAKDATGKLHWLPQGADGRVAGLGKGQPGSLSILFTGLERRAGHGRAQWVADMRYQYGARFHHVSHGVHGVNLANLIACANTVVAPMSPVTDRYWSNRVYISLGFGAFLLHPMALRLMDHYDQRAEVVYYEGFGDLQDKIKRYEGRAKQRKEIAHAGLTRTLREHLYRHRVEQLLATTRDVLSSRGTVGGAQ